MAEEAFGVFDEEAVAEAEGFGEFDDGDFDVVKIAFAGAALCEFAWKAFDFLRFGFFGSGGGFGFGGDAFFALKSRNVENVDFCSH